MSDWSLDVCSSDLQECAERCDHEPELQCRIFKVVQATRHAHEPEHVQRRERQPVTGEPEPERDLAPERIELEAHRLREPVVDGRKQTEQHAADDHVMEVRDQKQAVVKHAVRRSEEKTSELQSLKRISYAVFCLKLTTDKIWH